MSDLLWPGDHRAGALMGDAALLEAMVAVEQAWLDALVAAGIAPPEAAATLPADLDVRALAEQSEDAGTPVPPLLAALREQLESPAAHWLHRGLTSQDVVDTALAITVRDAVRQLRGDLAAQVETLVGLVRAHRGTVTAARTLTQHAVPLTFGLRAAHWLTGVLDADDDLARVGLPAQLGGAAGTLAATTVLTHDDPAAALRLADDVATRLGLEPAPPWHTTRAPITRLGDALVTCTDALGHIANDVLTLGRPETGEVAEVRAGAGGSSTMPHKANPVLSVLVRRAALTAPALAATLHAASASSQDERSPGGWQAEASTLRILVRRTVIAASQTSDLLEALDVRTGRMTELAQVVTSDLLAEQRAVARLAGVPEATAAGDYLGAADLLVDTVLDRAGMRS